MKNQLSNELKSMQPFWKGGTTLAQEGWSACVAKRKFQDLNGIVETCIRPYVQSDTVVLEIGANGGGWTHHFLSAKQVICFDALSPKHTGFWSHIGHRDNVDYFQVKDFYCNELENNGVDYVFSYDVFCHISYSGTRAYLENLYDKLKVGANCFIMIADANKYTHNNGRKKLMRQAGFTDFSKFVQDYDGLPRNGRWFFYGTQLFCQLLDRYGYKLVSEDVAKDLDQLNPIVHFRK
jgi:predicted SAM-dependent methyltransferase